MVQGQREVWKTLAENPAHGAPCLWMHVASVGEFEQGRPVLEAYRQAYPTHRIILTFFSPSGYNLRKTYPGADVVCYLPFDGPSSARRWLDTVQPDQVIFVKYEFWWYHLTALKQGAIPAILISARFRAEQLFFKKWGAIAQNMLYAFEHIFVQDSDSEKLLSKVGYSSVTIAGDTRIDRVLAIASKAEEIPLVAKFCEGKPVLVVGSSWIEDLKVLVPLWEEYRAKWRWVIAPHEISEASLKAIEQALSGAVLRYSRATTDSVTEADVLLIDNVGMLNRLYAYGQAAYIGGGFGKGLHNILEAVVYQIPVFFGGTNYHKFQEALDLINREVAFQVNSPAELIEKVEQVFWEESARLAAGARAKEYIETMQGATQQIMDYLLAHDAG